MELLRTATLFVIGMTISAQPVVLYARTDTVATTGGDAPNTAGTPDGQFDTLNKPLLNENGHVAFSATLTATSGGADADSGIYRRNPDSSITEIARENDFIVTGAGSRMGDAFAADRINLNDPGQVAFVTNLRFTATESDTGIFLGSGGVPDQIVRESQSAPGEGGGTFGDFLSSAALLPRLNNVGHVAYVEDLINGADAAHRVGVFRSDGTGHTVLAREGNFLTSEGAGFVENIVDINPAQAFAFNDAGQAALIPTQAGSSGNFLDLLVRTGGPERGEVLVFGSASFPVLQPDNFIIDDFSALPLGMNAAGTVAAVADGESDVSINIKRVFATDHRINSTLEDTTPLSRVLEFQQLPGTDAKVRSFPFPFENLVINSPGHTFLRIGLFATAAPLLDDTAIIRAEPNAVLTTIARTGHPAPDGNGVYDDFVNGISANAHGAVLFNARLRDTAAGVADNDALVIADATEQIQIVRTGDLIDGKTVTALLASLGSGGEDGMPTSLNDSSQVAYQVTFDTGEQAVYLFTPDVRWRSNTSGDWDDHTNWTLSQPPNLNHEVTLDPAASTTIHGPTTPATVRSLTVGGGVGTATLHLGTGTVASPQPIHITASGALTGEGTVDADVDNHGTVLLDNVHVTGTLTNHNLITGDGALTGDIRNAAGGTVRALNNEMAFPAGLTNQAGGLIAARDSLIDFGTGLSNDGNLTVSFGTSDFFGSITNNPAGRIIASGSANAVFFDDLANNGNVQVSAGSTAVYFGDVTGTGSFTGGGTNFLEADFSPGASPGLVTIAGDVVFGPVSRVLIEVQAPAPIDATPTPGVDHDQVTIGGSVMLNGTLDVDLLTPGMRPLLGTVFEAMTFAVRGGSMFFDIQGTLIDTDYALAPLFTDTNLVIRASIPGDLNLDNRVSVADLSTFALNFNSAPGFHDEAMGLSSWQLGDFNTDGAVTVADLSLLALNFGFDAADLASGPIGLSLTEAAQLAGIDFAALPEPAQLPMLVLCWFVRRPGRVAARCGP